MAQPAKALEEKRHADRHLQHYAALRSNAATGQRASDMLNDVPFAKTRWLLIGWIPVQIHPRTLNKAI
jgi:hypothetical protein